VLGRRWVLAAVIGACALLGAACDGTSRWILKQDAGQTIGTRDAEAPVDAGPSAERDADMALAGDAGGLLGDPEAFSGVCSPQVTIDNRTADGRGAVFDQTFAEPTKLVVETAKRVCAALYERPEQAPRSPPIVLVIEDFYGIGEIGITAPVIYIRLSSLRMESTAAAGQSVRDDVTGALHYLLAIDYELDDENPAQVRWITEGIAAFVRYRAGFTPLSERAAGGSPSDDYKTTGFFFDWMDREYPGAVYRLNQSLDPNDGVAWSEHVFVDLTGHDLDTLWTRYQASL
jgi:hypothetical protein